jgi:hypothetical protein
LMASQSNHNLRKAHQNLPPKACIIFIVTTAAQPNFSPNPMAPAVD